MISIPRVTVLIGAWNNEATLQRAIDSILGQTLTDFELLVIDDGSTDRSAAIAGACPDPRVRCLELPHAGISQSLNEGMRRAAAPLVAVLDADDVALPERLARQVDLLDLRPEVAVVGCQMREVDVSGRPLRRRVPVVTGDLGPRLLRCNPVANTAAMFRRDVVLAFGGFSPRYRFAMDYDLLLRIADCHLVFNLADELGVRELGSSNAGVRNERAQIAEAIRARIATVRRRRSLRGVGWLARPMLSFALPLPFKRRLRAARGQAP